MRTRAASLTLALLMACGGKNKPATAPPPSPAAAQDAAPKGNAGDAKAVAEVREWVAHPMEYGRPPKSATVIWHDKREWPFAEAPVDVYLVDYDMGDGKRRTALTGPTTWSFIDVDFTRFSNDVLFALYAGWYIEFAVINDPGYETKSAGMMSNAGIAAALAQRGLSDIQVLDSVQIGGDTYFSAKGLQTGGAVFAAGSMDDIEIYPATDPQMDLPPLYWYLGKTFYEK